MFKRNKFSKLNFDEVSDWELEGVNLLDVRLLPGRDHTKTKKGIAMADIFGLFDGIKISVTDHLPDYEMFVNRKTFEKMKKWFVNSFKTKIKDSLKKGSTEANLKELKLRGKPLLADMLKAIDDLKKFQDVEQEVRRVVSILTTDKEPQTILQGHPEAILCGAIDSHYMVVEIEDVILAKKAIMDLHNLKKENESK